MSINVRDMDDGAQRGASPLLMRAAGADARADHRLAVAIDDFFLPDDARLDDRSRSAMATALAAMVVSIDGALRQHAARLLTARDETILAEMLTAPGTSVLDRLVVAGLLRDMDLMRELVARVQQDTLGDALPAAAPDEPERPSLLARLVNQPDSVVAGGAMALLTAEGRRRGAGDGGVGSHTDLPADLHHRLVWWVAAALRERFATGADETMAALDRALAEAAVRSLAAHDEGDRLEAAAMRLAGAIEATPRELPDLLVETLGNRRIALFIALIAHAMGLDFSQAREVVLDPDSARLWLVLRALELDREPIARIGLALCDADPRRDIEAFADSIDTIAGTPADMARAALAPLRLHPDYRAALLALARRRA
ncbi:DUF2336 domain-containing protein [Sphingomonas sp. ERG5]|uniref:DUF2336 domain-containing protein n=1 Tax=Sphingomonas sp. ERG5 TaxID=1381597 RepID=UPI00054C56B2|nr:DUF2336 domain-containing protein [Sphingomonas sp. ERG5]